MRAACTVVLALSPTITERTVLLPLRFEWQLNPHSNGFWFRHVKKLKTTTCILF